MSRASLISLGLMALGFSLGAWVSHGGVWAEPVDAPKTPASGPKRDPFVPLIHDGQLLTASTDASHPNDAPLTLSGILWDPAGNSIALINETELKVGDTIQEYRLTEIRSDAAVLARGEESVVLQIVFEDAPSPQRAPSKP